MTAPCRHRRIDCDVCEQLAEDRDYERTDPMSERDWDAWEAGPGWNSYPGMGAA